MAYRIMVETEKSGAKKYYVQKTFLWYFWAYLREVKDISMYRYIIYFHSLEDAEKRIQSEVNDNYARSQSKVIKREVVSTRN